MKNKFKLMLCIVSIALLDTIVSGCGGNSFDENALHINYSADDYYGTEDYLGSTLTIAGDQMSKETQFTVKELEELTAGNENLQYQGVYSMMSRGGEFSNHEFTGVKLNELLQECGLKDSANDSTEVRFVSVDGYALTMELGEIRNSTDNTFDSKTDTTASEKNVPVILAFGSDGVPLTGTVGNMKLGEEIGEDGGYVEKAENVGGPIRLIASQKTVGEFNAPDNAKWIRQIIVGEDDNEKAHSQALTEEQNLRANDTVVVDATSGIWTHETTPYSSFLKDKIKVTGSEAKANKTYTLEDIEQMTDSTVTDSFGASCGVNGYRGVVLRDIVMQNLKDGIKKPSCVNVVGADGYKTEIDIKDLMNGIESRYQAGEKRDIIIAYSKDGKPLVANKKSEGFAGDNGFGPMRLVVENQTTRWVKNVSEIIIGE